jgi:hypothetical protein
MADDIMSATLSLSSSFWSNWQHLMKLHMNIKVIDVILPFYTLYSVNNNMNIAAIWTSEVAAVTGSINVWAWNLV